MRFVHTSSLHDRLNYEHICSHNNEGTFWETVLQFWVSVYCECLFSDSMNKTASSRRVLRKSYSGSQEDNVRPNLLSKYFQPGYFADILRHSAQNVSGLNIWTDYSIRIVHNISIDKKDKSLSNFYSRTTQLRREEQYWQVAVSTSGCPMCGHEDKTKDKPDIPEDKTVPHLLGQCPAIAQLRG